MKNGDGMGKVANKPPIKTSPTHNQLISQQLKGLINPVKDHLKHLDTHLPLHNGKSWLSTTSIFEEYLRDYLTEVTFSQRREVNKAYVASLKKSKPGPKPKKSRLDANESAQKFVNQMLEIASYLILYSTEAKGVFSNSSARWVPKYESKLKLAELICEEISKSIDTETWSRIMDLRASIHSIEAPLKNLRISCDQVITSLEDARKSIANAVRAMKNAIRGSHESRNHIEKALLEHEVLKKSYKQDWSNRGKLAYNILKDLIGIKKANTLIHNIEEKLVIIGFTLSSTSIEFINRSRKT